MARTPRQTPATLAREAAGYTLEDAARRSNISVEHYRRCELRGFAFVQADVLARRYNCRMEVFLPPGR